ncbi:hypothetical protein SERLA73DRAFT_50363 [Serpula lacrymans var. lacrymans S7.3]|uniref:Inositol polyphosphate-related phosphatase domain-containing protein n=1 Tax=Serpula lacrymans var. lacrymans (strain S7.3) TaxID=936435 RepID=F8PRL7_SERL3|nr:hypothetical protein SERLA73DRAFT_50363 [Serpula lacrymans var. lacrymans S7.3]
MVLDYGYIDRTVTSCLRSTEELRVALEANWILQRDDRDQVPSMRNLTYQPVDYNNNVQNKRILAVIVHKLPDGRVEEGGLFVFKYRSRALYDGLRLQWAYPIVTDFTIGVSQPKKEISSSNLPSSANSSRSEFTLTLKSQDGDSKPLSVKVQDTQRLQRLLAEYNYLKSITDSFECMCLASAIAYSDISCADKPESAYDGHQWIAPYIRKQKSLPSLVDIRISRQPLHLRLSSASAGLPGDDMGDIDIIREDWVRRTAIERCKSASPRFRLRIGTFNVNGKNPSQDLSAWVRGGISRQKGGKSFIPPVAPVSPFELFSDPINNGSSQTSLQENNIQGNTDADPDVLVLGFQELDLSTEALLYSTSTLKEDAWVVSVFAALGEKAAVYQKLASKQLVGMLLLVIVKSSLAPYFSNVKSSVAGSGIMGIMASATALRITYTPPTSPSLRQPRPAVLTFVNSHLAAFDEMVDRRNYDFHELSRRLAFESNTTDDVASTAGAPLPSEVPTTNIYETDALFWIPDLNYRLDIDDSDVRSLIVTRNSENNNMATLVKYDQLRNAIRAGKAFAGFSEYPVTHPPFVISSQHHGF